jgi:hypothetical protein
MARVLQYSTKLKTAKNTLEISNTSACIAGGKGRTTPLTRYPEITDYLDFEPLRNLDKSTSLRPRLKVYSEFELRKSIDKYQYICKITY